MSNPPGKRVSRRAFLAAAAAARSVRAQSPATVHVVPNFHPASCGWLTHFSKERVYCANSYFDHLDRVRDDPEYGFVLSEVNNIIAMMNFRPERTPELKRRIAEGRVEAVNAFFLESTVSLSGGEALVRLGVEGLRWQERMLGVRPRFGWIIDICGMHAQMAQICAGLGLEAMVYCRHNPTGKSIHWTESPDGSRILTLSPGHYSEFRTMWIAKGPLGEKESAEIGRYLDGKRKITPAGAPVLVLAGSGDYSLAPARPDSPSAFLKEWHAAHPGERLRFTTLGKYLDAFDRSKLDIPTLHGDTAYDHAAFWVECPRVKGWYRECEHELQAAEMAATCASLEKKHAYPVDALQQAWLQMFLNMDRNTLWGAAGGMVFEHERSWDARDRFEWVARQAREAVAEATRALLKPGDGVALVNPLSWRRKDPFFLPAGTALPSDLKAHSEEDRILCAKELWCGAVMGSRRATGAAPAVTPGAFVETISTTHYRLRIDRSTGAIVSLKLWPDGREMLGGPANVVVAEKAKKQRAPGDFLDARPLRDRLGSSCDQAVEIAAASSPLAIVIDIRGTLLGKPCRRRIWLHKNYSRIDFETEIHDLPDGAAVVAEFPLAGDVSLERRGIPYGFSQRAPAAGIVPAVRWSHYEMAGRGGVALFDRGLPGRELNGRTPLLYLLNAVEKYRGYPNPWLSGAGRHVSRYALAAHRVPWAEARIPQMAWEFNAPPIVVPGCTAGERSWFYEASDNMIVESLRRVGGEIELRMVECLGLEGDAELTFRLPFREAWVTDLTGRNRKPIGVRSIYRLPVRAQQIVTMRFRTEGRALAEPKPLTEWDALVPEPKRAALHEYTNDKGHPPFGY